MGGGSIRRRMPRCPDDTTGTPRARRHPPPGPGYDERSILPAYVLRRYGHLMTEREPEGMKALRIEEKAESLYPGDDPPASAYRARWWRVLDPQAAREACGLGAEAFRRRICARLLADHGDAVAIRRCPVCGRVVRSPRARQCFWCGHDWHPGAKV
jgi:hypothetical protein